MKIRNIMMVVAAMATGSLFAESGFSYQGRLVGENDVPMTNDVPVRFSIYRDRSGGSALWAKELSASPNSNGTFNVELVGVGKTSDGSSITLDKVLSTSDDRYLEISVVGASATPDATVTPRQKILPVPNAIYAQNVGEARGDFAVHGTASFYGSVVVYDDVRKGSTPSMTLGSDGSLEVVGTLVSGDVTAESGKFNNDVSVAGDLKVGGNVTLTPSQDGTVFRAEQTAFKVKSLEVVNGGELTVNGINPGVPVGVISIWSGDLGSVPASWAVCDGNNGTPDLTGRFIVGAGTSFNSSRANDGGQPYSKGASGGKREVALTIEEMPRHYHEYFGDDQLDVQASRVRNQPGYDAQSQKTTQFPSGWFKTSEAGGTSGGGTAAHENLPPYYALFYIILQCSRRRAPLRHEPQPEELQRDRRGRNQLHHRLERQQHLHHRHEELDVQQGRQEDRIRLRRPEGRGLLRREREGRRRSASPCCLHRREGDLPHSRPYRGHHQRNGAYALL